MTLVYLQQVKRDQTKLIDCIFEDDCDCSIDFLALFCATEQHRKLLELDSSTEKNIAIQNMT